MTGSGPDAPTPRPPKKSLGQNFLVDPNLQRKIVEAVRVPPGGTVLEIGPGRGALTRHLVERGDPLVLVELDDDLAAWLAREHGGRPAVRVVHGDVLDLDLPSVVPDVSSLVVVGNIPYNITTPILFKLLERPRPREIVIMVQKEVAERVVAEPGGGAYGALAVGVRSVARAEALFDVGRKAFRPVPGVDSTVLRIRPFHPPVLTPSEEERLRHLTRAAFQWRRKQMGTTLRKHPDLELGAGGVEEVARATGLDLRRRPETFSPEELDRIARAAEAGRDDRSREV